MPRFFCNTSSEDQQGFVITGDDAKHIARSLRCKVGEELIICNGTGMDYCCEITTIADNIVEVATLSQSESKTEPPVKVTLYQAMPKSDKIDLIIQKCVELGVTQIVPVLTKYCVSRPDDKAMGKKLDRFNKIALEAAKQSGRSIIPTVLPIITLKEAYEDMKKSETAIVFYEHATSSLGKVLAEKPASIAVLIGAEGGFAQAEIDQGLAQGLHVCTMGPRILRCETAAIYALAAITYEYENR